MIDAFKEFESKEELAAAVSYFLTNRARGNVLSALGESIALFQTFRKRFNLEPLTADQGLNIISRGRTIDAKLFIMCAEIARLLWEQKEKRNENISSTTL